MGDIKTYSSEIRIEIDQYSDIKEVEKKFKEIIEEFISNPFSGVIHFSITPPKLIDFEE